MERDRLAVIVNEVCNRSSKVGLGNGASETNILKKKVSRTVREKKNVKQTVVLLSSLLTTRSISVCTWTEKSL